MPFLRNITRGFSLRRMNWALLCSAVLLALIGAMFITSARSLPYAKRHLMFLAAGVSAFIVMAALDYRHLANLSVLLYGGGLTSLGLLPIFGVARHSATSWYSFGLFDVQPAEPMKFIMLIVLATYFTQRIRFDRVRDLFIPMILMAPPLMLIVQQPDLGTAMIFIPGFFVVAYLAGAPLKNLMVLVLAGVGLLVGAWFAPGALKDHQKQRVVSFVYPERNPRSSASYNARQATLAVTGGGLFGQGWGRGRLTRLRRLPESYADFIFAVIAEEWGLARTAALVGFFMLLLVLIAQVAWSSNDAFGRLLAGGILATFGFQMLLHMAVSVRLAPITGVTLPLVSYGGSSLVSTLAGLGLVASIQMRREHEFVGTLPTR